METWELLSILSSSLVAIIFSGPWVALSPSFKCFHPKLFLGIVGHMSQTLAPAITVLMPFSVLSMIPLVIESHDLSSLLFTLNVTAFVLSMLSLLIVVTFELPVLNEVAAWTSQSIPTTWERQRDRWLMFHRIRVAAGLASLLLLIVAGLIFAVRTR